MNEQMTYTRTAIALHWLVALLIILGWSIGFSAADLPASPEKLRWVNWHKWIGVTILAFVMVRSLWRLGHNAPELPETVPDWQFIASQVTHSMLYLLMLVTPAVGWMASSARGYEIMWFGVIPLPALLSKDPDFGGFLQDMHELLAWALAGFIALHLAGAMKHILIDKDNILRRMLPVLVVALLVGATVSGRVDASHSQISATFRQMNVPVEVPFRDFSGEVSFDPKNPTAPSGAQLEVRTASFDIGSAEYNDEVRKPQWFDTPHFPKATFASSRVTPAGPGSYVATGNLTFKGRTAPIDVLFTAYSDKGSRVYEGTFPLSRKAWAVGDPEWDDVLEDQVLVKFRIFTNRK